MRYRFLLSLSSVLISGLGVGCISTNTEQKPEAVDLLSEDLFPQWIQKGGKADFEFKDGVLIGTSKPNTPNSFLCPPKRYANFELQFEVKGDNKLNSGVQIRSSSELKDINDQLPAKKKDAIKKKLASVDRLFGPQVEIASNGNAGGIWFEVGGGWILEPDAKRGKTIYKNEEWNHYRVIANGPHITVFINGEKIGEVEENITHMKEGYLGFQVHSVSYPEPTQVMWRNVTIKELP